MRQFKAGKSSHSVAGRSMSGVFVSLLLAAFFVHGTGFAQTKPKVRDLGEVPTSALYVGNSFFITTIACTGMSRS